MIKDVQASSFAIGIPTINRWDLLRPSLENYCINFPITDILIIDNGKQGIKEYWPNVKVIEPAVRLSVAESWNVLCDIIFKKYNNALILNDDIYIDKKFYDIEKLLSLHPECDFYVSQQGFNSFIIPKKTFRGLGTFDINFKGAYFEDKDYERRLKLAKLDVLRHKMLNSITNNESSSIKKDPDLNLNYQANYEYYVKKWGGNLGGEKYLTPFNN